MQTYMTVLLDATHPETSATRPLACWMLPQVPHDLVEKIPDLASHLGDLASSKSSSSSSVPAGKQLDNQQDNAPYGSGVQHSATGYGRSAAALSPAGPQQTPAVAGAAPRAAVSTSDGAGATQQLLPMLQR
jgi:hypothetical protein